MSSPDPVVSEAETLLLQADESDMEIVRDTNEDVDHLAHRMKKTTLDEKINDSIKASKRHIHIVEKVKRRSSRAQRDKKRRSGKKIKSPETIIPRVKRDDKIKKRPKSVVVAVAPKPIPKTRVTTTPIPIMWMMKEDLPGLVTQEKSLKGKSLVVNSNPAQPITVEADSQRRQDTRPTHNDPHINNLTNRMRIYRRSGTSIPLCFDCGRPGHVVKHCPHANKFKRQ